MDASVQSCRLIVGLKLICIMQWMFIRASAADSRSLVVVVVKYF